MSKATILIVGGAGYIGSHTNALLSQQDYTTIVFDNLTTGHRELVQWGTFIEGDLGDENALRSLFRERSIDAVLHFAALAYVGESVNEPAKYYDNNVVRTINLLNIMREFDVKRIVFSSTCATYGKPNYLPLDELHSQAPINPYGQTKLMVEKILSDYSCAYGMDYVVLRYFNAAGADPGTRIGEWHDPETHLIPLVLNAAMDSKKPIRVFGTDYETKDGTCVRDYIHVSDLAEAHVRALEYLAAGGSCSAFNLGSGQGYSVREVIDAAREVTGQEIPVTENARRAGDPPILVGSSEKARRVLGWNPQFTELKELVETA
ncbi:MAG: UDP-glucose 4-epimerase GalE [Candidatus Hydrogenedentota bacterium]